MNLTVICMSGCLLLMSAQCCFAYIDPGTGSYFVQILMGIGFAALYMLKLFWHRVMAFMRRLFHVQKDEDGPMGDQ